MRMATSFFDEFIDPTKRGNFVIRAEHYVRYLFAGSFLKKKQTVYDIGCGNGYGLQIMTQDKRTHSQTMIGFDNSTILLSQTPKMSSTTFFEFNFEKHDFLKFVKTKKLPKPNLIIAFEVLEHLQNPEELLKQLATLLEKNGTLVLSVPNMQYEPKKKGKSKNKFHKQLFSPQRLETILKEAGFKRLVLFGQPRTNQLYHRSKLLNRSIDILTNHSWFLFTTFSKAIAYPTKNTSEKSYSIIIVAKK